jgi:hypothetical protein
MHTPLPWRVIDNHIHSDKYCSETPIATIHKGKGKFANAAYIVQCVNSHEALLAALAEIIRNTELYATADNMASRLCGIAKAAIEAVEGR